MLNYLVAGVVVSAISSIGMSPPPWYYLIEVLCLLSLCKVVIKVVVDIVGIMHRENQFPYCNPRSVVVSFAI